MSMQLFEDFIKKYIGSNLVHEKFFDNPSYFTSNRLFDHIAGKYDKNAKDTMFIDSVNISNIKFLFKAELDAIYKALKNQNFYAIDSEDKLSDFMDKLDDKSIFNEFNKAYLNLAAALIPYFLNGSQVRDYISETIDKDIFDKLTNIHGKEKIATTFVKSMAFRLFSETISTHEHIELKKTDNEKLQFRSKACGLFAFSCIKNFNFKCSLEEIQLAAVEKQITEIEKQIVNPILKKIEKYLNNLGKAIFSKGKETGVFPLASEFESKALKNFIIETQDIIPPHNEVSFYKMKKQYKAALELKEIISNKDINIEERFKKFTDNFNEKKLIILNGDSSTKQESSKFVKTILDIISLGIYKLARIIKTRHERNLVKSTENVINKVSEVSPQLKMGIKK